MPGMYLSGGAVADAKPMGMEGAILAIAPQPHYNIIVIFITTTTAKPTTGSVSTGRRQVKTRKRRRCSVQVPLLFPLHPPAGPTTTPLCTPDTCLTQRLPKRDRVSFLEEDHWEAWFAPCLWEGGIGPKFDSRLAMLYGSRPVRVLLNILSWFKDVEGVRARLIEPPGKSLVC